MLGTALLRKLHSKSIRRRRSLQLSQQSGCLQQAHMTGGLGIDAHLPNARPKRDNAPDKVQRPAATVERPVKATNHGGKDY
eukprot:CAMPEP_0169245636 /NCGR_PEP_ID=MMETSP1016-20121227/34298_1 /TAXON_ID=342587 /ORGANISM="Karlodinium micrum, Strain CCMP2283" /LENGTH=80 /DNA_ID=CAMNT_0009326145 /DNA_START=549 /DNA_END=788 /DNA_ORIENTATION=+